MAVVKMLTVLRFLRSRNWPNPTRNHRHHPNQTTAKMSVVERQEMWLKWMQFQNKAIIHCTPIMDSLFIDIVQFIFDVYRKIRLFGLVHSINNSLRVLNYLMSGCSKYRREIKGPVIRVTYGVPVQKPRALSPIASLEHTGMRAKTSLCICSPSPGSGIHRAPLTRINPPRFLRPQDKWLGLKDICDCKPPPCLLWEFLLEMFTPLRCMKLN